MLGLRKSLRSSKRARRKRVHALLYGALIVFIFSCLILVTVYLLNRPEVTVTNIIFEGNTTVSENDLRESVLRKLEGKYLFLFPRSSIFLYSRASIEEEVLTSFRKVEEVEAGFDSFNSIYVRVKEREPQSLWCGENRLPEVTPECYFLDEKGIVYTKAPNFTGDIYFRFYSSLEAGDPVGLSFLPEKKFRELSFFLSSLRESGIVPVELAVPDESDYELYLDGEVRVLFPRDRDFAITLDNLQSVFASDEFKNQEELKLDYIDLRFGNKVYYKFLE